VNAGGVVAVGAEYAGRGSYDEPAARERARAIGDTVREVLARAEAEGILPLAAAERTAEDRVAAAAPRPPYAVPDPR
jgi:glutamate dehydrogenase/leucine dehydrogenase